VGIGEKHALGRQLVEVRGDRAGLGSEASEPVVHVIYREEEDVWLSLLTGRGKAGKQEEDDEGEDFSHDGESG
jgi:hypothetical protein